MIPKPVPITASMLYDLVACPHRVTTDVFADPKTGYLKNMIAETKESVYEQVVYQSDVEPTFADQFEKNSAVKDYAKLPGWFTVPTPLGTYNPDWAVLIQQDGQERLYFVVETKWTLGPTPNAGGRRSATATKSP